MATQHDRDRGRHALAVMLGMPVETFESEYLFKQPWVRHLSAQQRADAAVDPAHPRNLLSITEVLVDVDGGGDATR